jgi:hypothetical protein
MGTSMTGRADNRPVVLMAKYPDETFTYSVSLTSIMNGGSVQRVAVASAPSGLEELRLTDLVGDGTNAVLTIAGGQPGRIYTIKYAVTFDNAEVRELLATLTVGRVLRTDQPGIPHSEDFGGTLRWPPEVVAIYGFNQYGDGSVYGGPF